MRSDAASNTNIDVDVMPETSTDNRPNVPKSVNLASSCTVDDDSILYRLNLQVAILVLRSMTHYSPSTVSKSGISERLRKT